MRCTLFFSLKHEKLPGDLRHSIISFIKTALTQSQNGEFFPYFFDQTKAKPYTWSLILHRPVFAAECITVTQLDCKIRVSVMNSNGMERVFISSLMAMRGIEFPLAFGNYLCLQRVQLEKDISIQTPHILVRTVLGGGICVRNHNRQNNTDIYYAVDDASFNDYLTITVKHQLERLKLPADSLAITCVEGKKVMVRHMYGQFFPVTIGYFYLQGNPYVLEQLVAMGIGSRRSQGYGMVQVVSV